MRNNDIYLYAALLLLTVTNVWCEEADLNIFDNAVEMEGMINPHSFHYDKNKKKMLSKEEFVTQASEVNSNPSKSWIEPFKQDASEDNDTAQERIYYTRLVNLLLSNIVVKTKDDESIVGILNLEISDSQMKVLKSIHTKKIPLRELDAIMSNVIKGPHFSFIEETTRVVENLHTTIQYSLRAISEYMPVITICCITIIAVFVIGRRTTLSRGLPICIIIQIVLLASFLMTWWQLIQEAEVKLTAAQMQYAEMPITCQPHKMNIWHKFVAFISPTNDCEKYYDALMTNAKLKVTPALALSHFISTIILHPVSHVGHATSEFIDKCTDRLSWPFAWIVRLMLFICVGLVILILPICIFRGSFAIGFWPLGKFDIDFKSKHKAHDSIEGTTKREPVQIILQISHANSAPAIASISEAGGAKVLGSVENSQKTDTNLEDHGIKCIKNSPENKDKADSSEDICLESNDMDTDMARQGCRRNSPKNEVGAGDS